MRASVLNRLHRRLAASDNPRPESTPEPLRWDILAREPQTSGESAKLVTRELLARLPDRAIEDIESRLDAETAGHWNTADASAREWLTLPFALYLEVPGVEAATGLSAVMPPPGVHIMGSGPVATGGAYGVADLVLDGLSAVGVPRPLEGRLLDFGCSSGRVLRVLRAAYPDVDLHGCDPNREAVDWAKENLTGIDCRISPQEPPLDYPDAYFDTAYAVSIWSHFGEGAALRWLDEMHRIIRPGGTLLLTVHGWNSPYYLARERLWDLRDAEQAADDLYRRGFHYLDVFGEDGDFGVKSREWGMAFMTMEWLTDRVTPAWSLELHRTAFIEDNQDLVVLRRR
jgi:SAM-dependent methyltransferase